MIPNYINSSPSPFPVHEPSEDHDQHHQFFVPNYHSASSSSLSCHVFFNSPQDQTEYYQTLMHRPPHHQEDENQAGSYDLQQKDSKSLKLTLWKNEKKSEENPDKWMSSKMRLMQKMKNSASSSNTVKIEDQKQGSSSFEGDHLSSNSSSYNSSPPVRVCADCNTTKTPLWRSGPKGPKSLCNACGIRQRKARRAMAAAAAAGNSTGPTSETAALKIKVHNKEKIKSNGHAAQFKKRCKLTAESSDHAQKKNVFEDFLFNLSKNLAFHRVFPQDEKEAAILLMALSCGLVHG